MVFFADQGIPSTQLHGCCDNGFASSSDWRTTLCATQKLGVPLQQDVLGNWSSGKHFVSFILLYRREKEKNHKTPLYFSFSEKVNFLGISIVGQSNKRGDGGIYVGSIMKG